MNVDIPCRKIPVNFTPHTKALVIEINLKNRKWLLFGIYDPHENMTTTFLRRISLKLDELSLKYENILILGDFNSEMCEEVIQIFCTTYNFTSCEGSNMLQNIISPSCIDLILTIKSLYFQNTAVVEAGLADLHRPTLTVMKSTFQKQVPKILTHRN